MKILHVIPSFSTAMGGPAIALKNLCEGLSVLGVSQTIVTLYECDIEVAGVETHEFKAKGKSYGVSKNLKKWLTEHLREFDLVQIHSIWLYHSYITSHLCQKFKIPYVIRLCGMLDSWSMGQKALKKKIYFNLLEKKNIIQAGAIHCTSETEVIDSGVKAWNSNVHVIANCIEKEYFAEENCRSRNKQFLYLGRLHYKKQPDILIRAFSRFKKQDYKLILAGTGEPDYVDYLHKLAETCDGRVSFVGEVSGDNKIKLFQESAAFVLPSQQENFGVAVAEAMTFGCIPIISNEVALSGVVEESRVGIVTGIDEESILSGLQKFTELEQGSVENMRRQCMEISRDSFHPENIANKFLNLYKYLM